jgi:putative toxin-antitoxin system antitoxin component (TIGR02293 family)
MAHGDEVHRQRSQAPKRVSKTAARLRRTRTKEGVTRSTVSSSRSAAHGEKAGSKELRTYGPHVGVDVFIRHVHRAEPLERVEIERRGVPGRFVKDLAKTMDIPAVRMFDMIGIPKATAEKKSAAGEMVSGSGGQAALGVARLVGIVREIVENSTAAEARKFDAAKWLGQWLERPQPALGGRKPAMLLDTPTGVEIVARLLGAIESGSYQ